MTECLILFVCFVLNNILKAIWNSYSTARVFFVFFFKFSTHPSGADSFTHCNPTQGSNQTLPVIYDMHTVIPLQSHFVSTQMGGITVGYKTLILSTQFKHEKVHGSDSPHCNPTQIPSETLPVFPLQCFHRNGWNHSGVRNFNHFHSVLFPLGWVGNWKTPRAVL